MVNDTIQEARRLYARHVDGCPLCEVEPENVEAVRRLCVKGWGLFNLFRLAQKGAAAGVETGS